ncbi:MAG: hypothetical protein ACK5O5_00170 [bacterium]
MQKLERTPRKTGNILRCPLGSQHFRNCFLILSIFAQAVLIGQEPPPLRLESERRSHQLLTTPTSLLKKNSPLGETLSTIAQQANLTLWLDRRIDPNALVEMTARDQPLGEILHDLASRTATSFGIIESTLYWGPAGCGPRIEAAHWQLLCDHPELRTRTSFSWEPISEPSHLLRELAANESLQWISLDPIEHDLWNEGRIEATTRAGLLTLMPAGDESTVQVQSSDQPIQLQIVPLPETAEVSAPYPTSPRSKVEAFLKSHPLSKARIDSGSIELVGPVADHRDWVWGGPSKTLPRSTPGGDPLAKQRFTARLQGTLAEVLQSLADSQGIQFHPWPLPESLAAMRIDVETNKASIDELLEKIGAASKVSFRRDRLKVDWSPQPNSP